MKKSLKLFLILIAILFASFISLIINQYDNIKAIILSMSISNEDISIRIDENDQILKNIMNKYGKYIPDDEKDMDMDMDTDNEASFPEEDLKEENKIITINNAKQENKQDKKQDDKLEKSSKNATKQKSEDEIISKYVTAMYSLKNTFVAKLEELETTVYNEYLKIPVNERNFESKKNLAFKYFDYVSNLEKLCDEEVSKNMKELEKELKEINADTSIVNDIKNVYENEKTLQKAYYLALLKEN